MKLESLANLPSTPERSGGSEPAVFGLATRVSGVELSDSSSFERLPRGTRSQSSWCIPSLALTPPSTPRAPNHQVGFTNDDLQAFSAELRADRYASLAHDAETLGALLAERGRVNGRDKLEILIVDCKGGSGHTEARRAVLGLLQDPTSALAPHVLVTRVDFHGQETGEYVKTFDARMAAERGLLIRAGHFFKAPCHERLRSLRCGQTRIQAVLQGALTQVGMSSTPDIIISVQPIGIGGLSRVAKKLGAQLRIVPTDFGLMDWYAHVKPHGPNDLSMRYDLSVGEPFLTDQLARRKLYNFNVVGMPVRRAFTDLAGRLARDSERAAAEGEIAAELTQQSGGSYKEGDRSVLLTMGGKGAQPKRYLSYVESLLLCGPAIMEPNQSLHIFVPAVRGAEVRPDLAQGMDEGVTALLGRYPEASARVQIHLLGRLEAESMAKLMKGCVTITKAGGMTSYELASLGGKALLNMRVTKYLPWESANVEFLRQHKLAYPLPTGDAQERAAMGDLLKQAWDTETQPCAINDFATVYQKSLMRDAITALQLKGLSSIDEHPLLDEDPLVLTECDAEDC